MWWYYLIRWMLFFLIGAPFQQLVHVLWLPLSAWFWFCVRGKAGAAISPPAPRFTTDELIAKGKQDPTRNQDQNPDPKGPYLNQLDDNGALTHMYLWMLRPEMSEPGLKGLVDQNPGPSLGAMVRKCPLQGQTLAPAGDEISCWVNAYISTGGDKEDLRKAAWHWLKNCMGVGTWCNGWQVSARSSCSGLNWCFDSWGHLAQPALGPQYFTSAALLRLAARDLGWGWWLAYFLHYWIMGGWLWWALPWANLPTNTFYYSQQITTVNLRSLYMLTKNPMYRWAIRYIVIHCADHGNCDPVLYGLAACTGALTQDEIDRGLRGIVCMKPESPQNEPWDQSFYDADINGQFYSLAGATAQELLKAKKPNP